MTLIITDRYGLDQAGQSPAITAHGAITRFWITELAKLH
jgi:hypothetical protein